MSTDTEVVEQVEQSDAEALASAMAGYNARGGNTPPAEVADEVAQQGSEEPANVQDEPAVEAQAGQEEVAATAPTLEERLAELKAEVRREQEERGHDAVRKLNSEIGDIKRHLKDLAPPQQPAEAPVDDELTAAIKKAEDAAQDFPDLAGPIVAALKVAAKSKNGATPVMSAEEISALAQRAASEAAQKARIAAAQESLTEEHPDWEQVRESDGFKAWFASKPAEYRDRLENTWNPSVVSKGLTEYKDSLRQQQQVKQQKENRLASAITPRGVPTPPAPSKLSDDEGFARGYAKAAPRPLHKR